MPTPPDYDKTLRVYMYLHERADSQGMVKIGLRKLAKSLRYKSWTTIRFHLMHLEEAGLIRRDKDAPRGPSPTPIQIVDPAVADIGQVYEAIAKVPRSSWSKRSSIGAQTDKRWMEKILDQRATKEPDFPIPASTSSNNTSNYDLADVRFNELTTAPLALWQALQFYLTLHSFVEALDDPTRGQTEELVTVIVRVSNVSPTGEDRPEVCFRNITLRSSVPSRYVALWSWFPFSSSLGNMTLRSSDPPQGIDRCYGGVSLEPGESYEGQFVFYTKELVNVEFRVSGDLDIERFFRFRRRGDLPGEVVQPLLKELSERFEAIGIKEPLVRLLELITRVQPTMTLADAAQVREELEQVRSLISEKKESLNHLRGEFHLSRESSLGARCQEVGLLLEGLGAKIHAVDDAIGGTDLDAMKLAANDLEQLQLLLLQLEETIRTMLNA